MINVSVSQIAQIRKSSVIKNSYDIKVDNLGVELIIDERELKHQIIYKKYNEKDRLIESELYVTSDDIFYNDSVLYNYIKKFDQRCAGILVQSESYDYDNNGNMILKYIKKHSINGDCECEDHLYQYDYKNRIIRESITSYIELADSVINTSPLEIRKMIRIDSYYDSDGNRFDTHIKIQENGYFMYELIKEVFLPAVQLYPHFHIYHVKIHGNVRTVNTPISFETKVKTKYPVFNKTSFEFIFECHKNIIAEKERHPLIIDNHQLVKVCTTTYYNIEYSFKDSENGGVNLYIGGVI